jgi:hypothetical protein
VSLYATADPPNQGVVHRWRFQTATQEADALAPRITIRAGDVHSEMQLTDRMPLVQRCQGQGV